MTASLRQRLEAAAAGYHDLHPFHVRMNAGLLSADEIRRWAANRFYYQAMIPRKDAAILANCDDVEVRRRWIRRIADHDGSDADPGGIEGWLALVQAVGLSRAEVLDQRHVLPGVRFAVDAYVDFCRRRPWIEGVAASLTELFAPGAIHERIAALERHYPWIDPAGLDYFRERLVRAPRDAEHALRLVLEHCRAPAEQDRAVGALRFKCQVLWAQLDAIDSAARAVETVP